MKVSFKVEKSDIVDSMLENFPVEVVEKMIEEQIKQGNAPSLEVFFNNLRADKYQGGFDWDETEDGTEFWEEVFQEDNFDLFFKKYPKNNNLVYVVSNGKEVGKYVISTLVKYGGINKHEYTGNNCGDYYFIDPITKYIELADKDDKKYIYNVIQTTFTRIDIEIPIIELTMEEIANKFGVSVKHIRIKK